MRGILRAAPAALALMTAMAGSAAAQGAPTAGGKVAYVNTQALFEAAPGRSAAESTFQRELTALQAQTKRMEDSLQTLVADYTKNQGTLTAAQRTTREQTIRTRQQEYQQRAQALEAQAGQRRDELMQPIMDQVKQALEDVRNEGGYAIIFAADPQSILAADKNLDVTDRVVARLRTLASRGTTAPARPASAAPTAAPSGLTKPQTP